MKRFSILFQVVLMVIAFLPVVNPVAETNIPENERGLLL